METKKWLIAIVMFVGVLSFQSQAQDNKSKDGVYTIVDEKPEYPGGVEALKKDITEAVKFPEEAKKKGISGKVYVSFVVNTEGKVEDAKIARGVESSLDEEAMRVMNSLKTWKPGKEDGKAVKVAFTVPINFALDNKSKTEEK